MALIKRVLFFVIVNILVINSLLLLTSGILYFLTGSPYPPGGYYGQIALLAGVWGMGGSMISLYISKWMAKRMYGLQILAANTRDPQAREIVEMVHQMAKRAGLSKMPEVGIYQSPDMNAFATGPSRNSALVAVSSGLVRNMNRNQVEGVIAHEVSHIANGDMVTLALITGVVNSFAIFLGFIVARLITSQMERQSAFVEWIIRDVLVNVFVFLATPVIMYFSRWREFRADAGAARYSSRENMISALEALKKNYFPAETQQADGFAAFKISSPGKKGGFWALFKSHPDLDDRIAALQRGRF